MFGASASAKLVWVIYKAWKGPLGKDGPLTLFANSQAYEVALGATRFGSPSEPHSGLEPKVAVHGKRACTNSYTINRALHVNCG